MNNDELLKTVQSAREYLKMRDLERKVEERFRKAEEQRHKLADKLQDSLDSRPEGMMIEYVIEVKRTRIRGWPWRKLFHRIWCTIFKHRWTTVVGMDNPDYRMESCRRCGRIDEVDTMKTQPFHLFEVSVEMNKGFERWRKARSDYYKEGSIFPKITAFGRKRRVRP